jgi:hypothetical protein
MASASLRNHRVGERKQRGPNFNAERVGGLSSSTNSYGSNGMVYVGDGAACGCFTCERKRQNLRS